VDFGVLDLYSWLTSHKSIFGTEQVQENYLGLILGVTGSEWHFASFGFQKGHLGVWSIGSRLIALLIRHAANAVTMPAWYHNKYLWSCNILFSIVHRFRMLRNCYLGNRTLNIYIYIYIYYYVRYYVPYHIYQILYIKELKVPGREFRNSLTSEKCVICNEKLRQIKKCKWISYPTATERAGPLPVPASETKVQTRGERNNNNNYYHLNHI